MTASICPDIATVLPSPTLSVNLAWAVRSLVLWFSAGVSQWGKLAGYQMDKGEKGQDISTAGSFPAWITAV